MRKILLVSVLYLSLNSCEILNPFELTSSFEVEEQPFYLINDSIKFINNSFPTYSADWDFGDGQTKSFSNSIDSVYHVYTSPGTYQVKLTVSNNLKQDVSFKEIQVGYFKTINEYHCENLNEFTYKGPSNTWEITNNGYNGKALICPQGFCSGIEFNISLKNHGYILFWVKGDFPYVYIDNIESNYNYYGTNIDGWSLLSSGWIEPGIHTILLNYGEGGYIVDEVIMDEIEIRQVEYEL